LGEGNLGGEGGLAREKPGGKQGPYIEGSSNFLKGLKSSFLRELGAIL